MIGNEKEILAITPARGGSKGVFRKNIKILCGKPLIYYSIKSALNSRYIDRLVVSTEDDEIAEISKKYNSEVIKRPKELATDHAPSIPVYKHVLKFLKEKENYQPDIVVIIQPTSPLRDVEDVDRCIEKLFIEKSDSVITVRRVKHSPQFMVELDEKKRIKYLFNRKNITRRQDAKEVYIPNGAVFVTWSKTIIEKNTDRGPDTRAIIMPMERSVDIDTEFDFYMAEKLMEKNEKYKN